MRAGLADEQELRPRVPHRLADRLTREQVIAEIHRLEPRIASTVGGQPAPRRTTLAVLLVMAVLRNDELRLQWHRAVMAGANQRRSQHGVEILDAILAALAGGAGRAVDLGGVTCPRFSWTAICPTGGSHGAVQYEQDRTQRCD